MESNFTTFPAGCLRITFLGTGTSSGVPMIGCDCPTCTSPDPRDKRLRTSALIDFFADTASPRQENRPSQRILIDAGPDFRQQMLRAGVRDICHILITHEHMDHIGGLDDVRAYNYLNKSATNLYGLKRSLKGIQKVFYYAFSDHPYPGVPEYRLHPIDANPFFIGPVPIVPVRIRHYKLPILAYRIGPLAYITDGSAIEDDQVALLQGADVLVINTIRRTPHLSHFSLPEALAVAARVGTPRTYLTHLSHQMEPHAQLAASLPQGIFPAYDGLQLLLHT